MARLYVANATMQSMNVTWRLDFTPEGRQADRQSQTAFKQKMIASGRQEPVGGDLPLGSLTELIQQLSENLGMIGEVEVPRALDGFVPLIFNIDRPVNKNTIDIVAQHNSTVKVHEGQVRRKKASVAANEALSKLLLQTVNTDPTRAFDVEFEQEEVSENLESSVAEGYHVDLTRSQIGRRR